jgi:hypothetical protein
VGPRLLGVSANEALFDEVDQTLEWQVAVRQVHGVASTEDRHLPENTS